MSTALPSLLSAPHPKVLSVPQALSSPYQVPGQSHIRQQPSSEQICTRNWTHRSQSGCRPCSKLQCSAEGLMQEVETPGRKDDGKEFALAMAQIAGDVKGQDLCLLHVAPLCTWTSWMLLVSVTSRPQLQAVLARVTREAKDVWDRCPRSNSPGQGLWEVQDYGDVVIHVFEPAQRDYYDLEGFYGAAEEVDIPEPQRPAAR